VLELFEHLGFTIAPSEVKTRWRNFLLSREKCFPDTSLTRGHRVQQSLDCSASINPPGPQVFFLFKKTIAMALSWRSKHAQVHNASSACESCGTNCQVKLHVRLQRRGKRTRQEHAAKIYWIQSKESRAEWETRVFGLWIWLNKSIESEAISAFKSFTQSNVITDSVLLVFCAIQYGGTQGYVQPKAW